MAAITVASAAPRAQVSHTAVRLAPSAVPAAGGRAVRHPASTYRRRRVVAAVLAGVVVLVAWAVLGVLGGGPLTAPELPGRAGTEVRAGEVYVVQPGDTVWSIATRLDPEGDPRPLVDRLVAAHGGATLHVGERLSLPAP